MFERFSDSARKIVYQAEVQAKKLGHDYIGTEHMLLALLAQKGTVASGVLGRAGASFEALRKAITDQVPAKLDGARGHLQLTPRSKKVLHDAIRKALYRGGGSVRTDHILRGLVSDGYTAAARALHNSEATLVEKIRQELASLSTEETDAEASESAAYRAEQKELR